jgi:hypothetical protein
VQPIVNIGYVRPLEAADIWPLPDGTSIDGLSESFESHWSSLDRPASGAAAPVHGKASMLRLFCRVFYADLLRSMALYFLVSPHFWLVSPRVIKQSRTARTLRQQVIGANLAGPTLLRRMVIFIQTPTAPISDGLLICAGFFFVQCIICLAQSHHDFVTLRLGASARSMLMTATFRRCGHSRATVGCSLLYPNQPRPHRTHTARVRAQVAADRPARASRGRFPSPLVTLPVCAHATSPHSARCLHVCRQHHRRFRRSNGHVVCLTVGILCVCPLHVVCLCTAVSSLCVRCCVHCHVVTGEVQNLMSSDAARMVESAMILHRVWTAPFVLIAGITCALPPRSQPLPPGPRIDTAARVGNV